LFSVFCVSLARDSRGALGVSFGVTVTPGCELGVRAIAIQVQTSWYKFPPRRVVILIFI
jgi:hypothetical protein